MKRVDPLKDLGRFSEPALLVLISLADGPKHGYAMTQDIASISAQRLGPAPCTARSHGWKRAAGSRRCRRRIDAAHIG